MKCKVILTRRLAVEIASELEQTEKYQLVELNSFDSYEKAKEYVCSDCPYSDYIVIENDKETIAIPKEEANSYKYQDYTFDHGFPALEMAEKYILEQQLFSFSNGENP